MTKGAFAKKTNRLICINSLVEVALAAQDLLMPVNESLSVVKVDVPLLGFGADD